MRHDCIIIIYVDDCGLCFRSKNVLTRLIAQLKNAGFDLTVEGSFSEFLGSSLREMRVVQYA